jgi:hypothetical protein
MSRHARTRDSGLKGSGVRESDKTRAPCEALYVLTRTDCEERTLKNDP